MFLICSALAAAQAHHPSWWNDVSPNATALVGIEWQSVRLSPFADAVDAELWGDLGFPDLPCLRRARQIVISSPGLLALAAGNFASLRQEARGFEAMTYRGVDMYFAAGKGVLSIARISDQLLMIGDPKTLQQAVDRTLHNAHDASPLLARAAQFSGKDLWVVASQLPDELASRFVPLNIDAQRFEGSVSLRNGLKLEAALTAASEQDAKSSAGKLQQDAVTFPSIARGINVTAEGNSIVMTLADTQEQVLASLRGTEPVETPTPAPYIPVEPPPPPPPPVIVSEKRSEKAVERVVEKPVEKPQVVRILGLDEGPKEFILPPPKSQNP